jgi:hypothetical protein
MRLLSVETGERRIDSNGPSQRPWKRALGDRPLEAGEAPAGVDAPAGPLAGRQLAVDGPKTDELALRRLAAATRARPDRDVPHAVG